MIGCTLAGSLSYVFSCLKGRAVHSCLVSFCAGLGFIPLLKAVFVFAHSCMYGLDKRLMFTHVRTHAPVQNHAVFPARFELRGGIAVVVYLACFLYIVYTSSYQVHVLVIHPLLVSQTLLLEKSSYVRECRNQFTFPK